MHANTGAAVSRLITETPHAILISGESGSGKMRIAKYLANEVLGIESITKHPYYLHVDFADTKGIEEVRSIRQFLSRTTTGKGSIRRVVILESMESLGGEGQNALLKTIEEPPKDTIIIMTAENSAKLLKTISSRATLLRVLPLSSQQCQEIINKYPGAPKSAYLLSRGMAGTLMSILESEEEHQVVKSINIAKNFLGKSTYERLSIIEPISKDRQQTKELVIGLERCLEAMIKSVPQAKLEPIYNKLQLIDAAMESVQTNVNSKLLLTNLAVYL
jgi:DNA polymerase III delta prime subunit